MLDGSDWPKEAFFFMAEISSFCLDTTHYTFPFARQEPVHITLTFL